MLPQKSNEGCIAADKLELRVYDNFLRVTKPIKRARGRRKESNFRFLERVLLSDNKTKLPVWKIRCENKNSGDDTISEDRTVESKGCDDLGTRNCCCGQKRQSFQLAIVFHVNNFFSTFLYTLRGRCDAVWNGYMRFGLFVMQYWFWKENAGNFSQLDLDFSRLSFFHIFSIDAWSLYFKHS